MRQLAPGLWQLSGRPRNAINAYVAGEVLIDAATRLAERRIMRQIADRAISAHALTHAHPDHQGSSHAICERLRKRFWTGPPHPVARALIEGEEVGGFTVLDAPGHSAGHVAYWRERDRVLILGDVLNNLDARTGIPGLHEPPVAFTPDPARNRRSARRLAGLRPALACFGHGAPLRDPGRLAEFVAGLAG